MQESNDLRALRDIGLTHEAVQAALAATHPDDARLARIVEIQREHLLVHDGRAAHAAVPWPALRLLLEAERDTLVVGDWVWWRRGAPGERGWVVAHAAPRNRLSRRDPAGGRQPLVANIDTALLVMGLDHDFNLRRLDRFLVLAHSAALECVVVLTKADGCADPASAVARVRSHVRLDVDGAHAAPLPTLALDGRDDGAREALAPWLVRGRTLVMLGSSGAGKTTLANTLARMAAVTGAVRASDGRGQHTTTVRTLRQTPGGACLIDTPGLRQLWLDADPAQLQEAFPEIRALASHCRYRNCRHAGEPGCAVSEQVAPERLRSYQKLLREANREGLDVFQRQRMQALYKRRTREARARLYEKTR